MNCTFRSISQFVEAVVEVTSFGLQKNDARIKQNNANEPIKAYIVCLL